MGKTFKLQGKEVPFNAIVEQQLLDFLESKGFSNDEIIKRVVKCDGKRVTSIRIRMENQIDSIDGLFFWNRTPKSEGFEFWNKLNIEYNNLKKQIKW